LVRAFPDLRLASPLCEALALALQPPKQSSRAAFANHDMDLSMFFASDNWAGVHPDISANL